jgi:hypothetical protein
MSTITLYDPIQHIVNGMLVETVYPEDAVAQLYKLKDTISDKEYTEKVHRFNST